MKNGHNIDLSVIPSNQWYNRRFGLDYADGIMTDPIKRTEMDREGQRLLYGVFADVKMGSPDPAPWPLASGAFGDRFVSALLGAEIVYHRDQAPSAVSVNASEGEMLELRVPDLQSSKAYIKLIKDAGALEDKYGSCDAGINMGSPLNVAVSLYGVNFLIACSESPEVARHVLEVIADTEFLLYHEFMSAHDPVAYPRDTVDMQYGNCPAIMLSPETYREVVLPVDLSFRKRARKLFLHHCGVFDRYIDIYRELKPDTVEIGPGSDYGAVCGAFPGRTFSLIVGTQDVESKSPQEIDKHVKKMIADTGCPEKISYMYCTDISDDMPDESVRALRRATKDIDRQTAWEEE